VDKSQKKQKASSKEGTNLFERSMKYSSLVILIPSKKQRPVTHSSSNGSNAFQKRHPSKLIS